MESLYTLYTRTFGKIKSGEHLDDRDYGKMTAEGIKMYNEEQHAAITLGASDGVKRVIPRAKKELGEMVKKMVSE